MPVVDMYWTLLVDIKQDAVEFFKKCIKRLYLKNLKYRKGGRHMRIQLQYAMRNIWLELKLHGSIGEWWIQRRKALTLLGHWWRREKSLSKHMWLSKKAWQIPWHLNQTLRNEWQFTKRRNAGKRGCLAGPWCSCASGRLASVYVAQSYDTHTRKQLEIKSGKDEFQDFSNLKVLDYQK